MAKGGRKVVVRITSDTRGLINGVTKADLTLKNLAKTGRAFGNVAGRAIATGAAVATAALTAMYNRNSKLIDQHAKMADQFGVTTHSLMGMKQAAELAGVSNEQLTGGLERMQRRVGLAAKDTGAAARAIKELGLNADEMAKMGADEQFRIIAQRISDVEGAGNQAALAYEIFGRSGQKLLKMMNDSTEAMDEAARRSELLGTSLNRVDSAKVEAANDSMTKAGAAAEGIFNRITAKLAPVIEYLANQFHDAAIESEGFTDQVDEGFNILIEGAGLAANAIRGIEIIIKGLEVAFVGFKSMIHGIWAGVVDLFEGGVRKAIEAINWLIKQANKVPGIDLPAINADAFIDTIRYTADSSAAELQRVQDELHNLMMEPLPSDQLKAKLKEIEEGATKAAEKVAAAAQTAVGGGSGGVMSEQEAAKIEGLRQLLLTEEQLEKESHARKLEELNTYSDQLFETEAEKKAALEELEAQHQAKLKDIRAKGLSDLEKFNAMSWDGQVQHVASALTEMTAGVAQQNRKMFELNKAAAIAEATVSGLKGAEQTWNAYPYPWNIPMTLAHIAGSVSRLSAIKNASFGGGGGAPSQAPQPGTPVVPAGGGGTRTGDSGGGSRIALNLRGDMFSRDAVLGLIDGINSAVKDGARLEGIQVS